MQQRRKRDAMSSYYPPKKRICLNLHDYSIPHATETKTTLNTLSLAMIVESSSSLTVQQNPIYSILSTEQFQGPLDHFYLFPWLPKELQLQIWKIAAADIDAQIITISSDTERAKSSQQANQYHQGSAYIQSETIFLRAQYIVPNILHACGDAREMALKYYRPVFAREIGGAPIYIAIDEYVMISQYTTFKQKQTLARYTTHTEAIKCVGDPDYCFTKWGFRVPEVKATSVNQLKWIAGQVVGRREQSRVTLEYLEIILKESLMD
ncbi:hypothetical protein EYC84_010468 [Monilinia fructicola]|uniref:2EXR domain-containing protein n=1 Tax=Monilinia fructicola TaxID=38448 RepID=A0A5M9JIA4_MONFR|nr:hypothetical protein EYC84_010468 [Monilinia fructicola]